jgi:hypothetical protein
MAKLSTEALIELLRRHAWKLLLAMTASIAVLGLKPVREGIDEDPSVPLGIAGISSPDSPPRCLW